MLLGFNFLLWTTHVTDEHLPLFGELKQAGYDGVEIPIFEGDPEHFARIGRVARDEGLRCTGVTVLPDAAHSAISADPAVRQAAAERLRWACDCLRLPAAKCWPDPLSAARRVHRRPADRGRAGASGRGLPGDRPTTRRSSASSCRSSRSTGSSAMR